MTAPGSVRVALRYGSGTLDVELPADRTTVVSPAPRAPAVDPLAAVVDALRRPVAGPPLGEAVSGARKVAISICDGTRAQPRRTVVPALLEELAPIVDLDRVVVLVATGTHRGNSPEELHDMLGNDVLRSVRVVNHDARDESSLVWVGRLGADVPVWLNREWLDADVRITTGLVEPHFFAGFSGGPKMVAPGLAGLETVLTLHDAARIGHKDARWGVIDGNPVHDDVRAIAAATGTTFTLDVVVDAEHRLVAAFGGELDAAHRTACAFVAQTAMRPVPNEFDVVLTSNSGFPLDQNLYQAVKGMSAAAQVVRSGGTIICAAECRDGFPDHGSYRNELEQARSPQALLDLIEARETPVPDQWQVQIQAAIQLRARVIMHTSCLGDRELSVAHLEHADSIDEAVATALAEAGPDARICVLPEGPHAVPYVRKRASSRRDDGGSRSRPAAQGFSGDDHH